jgi:hypothetical protein
MILSALQQMLREVDWGDLDIMFGAGGMSKAQPRRVLLNP